MTWLGVLALVLASAACSSRDQRALCEKAAREVRLEHDRGWVDACVRDAWSDKKIACMQRSGGMASLFCDG